MKNLLEVFKRTSLYWAFTMWVFTRVLSQHMALLLATKGLRAIVLTFARVCTILAKALICFCTFSLISKIALVLHIMTCDALRGPYWFTAICISCVYRISVQRLLTPSYKLVFACFDCVSRVANFKVGIMTLENLQTWSMVNACLLSLPLLKTGWLRLTTF